MKYKNWFWGVFFVLAAVFVVASQVGWLEQINEVGFWSILATIPLVALFIQGLISLSFFGVFLPLPFLYLIYQNVLGLPEISLWLLLLAALLASIGFSCIFHKKHTKACIHFDSDKHRDKSSHTTETIDDNHPYARVSFSSSSKYLHGDNLESGEFSVSFGYLEVFFDQAKLSPEGAQVVIDCSFGGMKLYIPKTWRVRETVSASLGAVDSTSRRAQPAEDAPLLTITGSVRLGGVEIEYI